MENTSLGKQFNSFLKGEKENSVLEKRHALQKKLFRKIFGEMVDTEYEDLIPIEILAVAEGAVERFKEMFLNYEILPVEVERRNKK